jgi:multiple sugar transport system substrate-binding protein
MSRCLILCAIALLLLALTGCVSKTGPAGDDVVLLLRATTQQLEVWQKAVDAFTESTKIPVTIQNEPYDSYFTKLQTMIAGGRPPDVVFMESTRFPEFVGKNALENLTPYLQKDPSVQAADYLPVAWAAYQYQGNTYGLPNDVAVLALAYNEGAAELAYVKVPQTGLTWDGYLKLAREMTADQDGDGRTDLWGTTVCPWWQVYVWQNGGELVDDIQNPKHSTLSTPEARQALQFLADLHLKERVAPSPSLTESMGRVEAFTAGRVGMIYIGRWDTPQLNKMEGRWTVADIPKGKLAANLGLGSCFSMPRGAKHPEQAFKLMAFLSGLEGQKVLLGGNFSTPTRPTLINSEYFGGAIQVGGAAPFARALKFMRPVPFTTRYTEISTIWEQELQLLWSGQKTVPEVTKRIDERVDKVLAEAQPATAWLLPLETIPN